MEKKNKTLIMVITLLFTFILELYLIWFVSGNWVDDLGDALRWAFNYDTYVILTIIFGIIIIIEIIITTVIILEKEV